MHRKTASKPVQVAPATVAALNDLMGKAPYFFGLSSQGNLTFFARYSWTRGGSTCPRQEVENYMKYVMNMPLEAAIDRTFTALAHTSLTIEA